MAMEGRGAEGDHPCCRTPAKRGRKRGDTSPRAKPLPSIAPGGANIFDQHEKVSAVGG